MHSLLADLRFGARALRKTPAVAAIAVLALTVGIGLTTTMFSIVYSALMRGLPYDDPQSIVIVNRTSRANGNDDGFNSMPVHDYLDFRAQSRSFTDLAAYYSGTANVSGTERAERYDGTFTTSNLFRVLHVQPVLGRGFRDGEDQPGAERVAVIGYRMWQDRFGGDRDVIGRSLRANGVTYTIIGVMPDGFLFPENSQIWMPLPLDPLKLKRGDGQSLDVTGRLRPGVSLDQASVEAAAIGNRFAIEHKETNDKTSATVRTYMEGQLGRQPRQLLWTMLGAVFFVLLIACANVANLLLDRAAHRTKEVGIRTALGASRWVVIRQFLVEALLLSSLSALLGLGVAQAGITLFNRVIADTQPPFWLDIRLHPPVLLFVAAVAVVASLVSGSIPAVQSSRTDISEILKDDSRGASSFKIGHMSRLIVVFEIALSCGLLVAAGLMIKSVTRLRSLPWGFETENVFTARLGFPATYTDTAAQGRFYEQLLPLLRDLPGAQGASLSTSLPGVNGGGNSFAIEGKRYALDEDYPSATTFDVTPGFFETFGLRVLQGRAIGSEDREETLPVVVVNQRFAHDLLGDASPIGRRIRLGGPKSTETWRTIVGVVPDSRGTDNEHPYRVQIFTPLAQRHANFVSIAVRTNGNAMALTPQVRDAVASLNSDIPIYRVYPMDEALARPTWFIRVFGTIFMIFGAVALLLASVGLYAVMAFSVSRRTRELGIRMALGAKAGDVVGMIFGRGLLQLAVGMAAGLALAAALASQMQVMLFDVQPRDPVIFGGVVAVLTLVGLAACLVPALRATRVDPLVALRTE